MVRENEEEVSQEDLEMREKKEMDRETKIKIMLICAQNVNVMIAM